MTDELEEGKCPTCPAQPLKERRSRCPICREWIYYTPEHPGHQIRDGFYKNGKPKWRKPVLKAGNFAWLCHVNGCGKKDQMLETLYEAV